MTQGYSHFCFVSRNNPVDKNGVLTILKLSLYCRKAFIVFGYHRYASDEQKDLPHQKLIIERGSSFLSTHFDVDEDKLLLVH